MKLALFQSCTKADDKAMALQAARKERGREGGREDGRENGEPKKREWNAAAAACAADSGCGSLGSNAKEADEHGRRRWRMEGNFRKGDDEEHCLRGGK